MLLEISKIIRVDFQIALKMRLEKLEVITYTICKYEIQVFGKSDIAICS